MLLIVYRGEKNKGISMPEERLRHSSEIVQQWQKRVLGRELSSRCVTGDGGQGRGGQREFRQYQRWHAGGMENTAYTNPSFSYLCLCFFPLAVCSPSCLPPEVPPAEGTGRPRDARLRSLRAARPGAPCITGVQPKDH